MKKQYLTALLILLVIPAALQAREFLNTVVHLNFGGAYSVSNRGEILDSEEAAIEDNIPDNKKVSHYETAYSATLDIVPTSPLILGLEEHAFKFGLRSTYRLHHLQQRVSLDTEIGDQLMDYRAWMLGPVIYYAPYIEPSDLNADYTASGGFTFYALYGRLDGNLTAFPSLRDSDIATGDYETDIKGYKFDIGVGAEVAICSLNVGVNIYHTYINFKMDDKIYSDVGKKSSLKEVCVELYIGIPIESFIEPLIPKF